MKTQEQHEALGSQLQEKIAALERENEWLQAQIALLKRENETLRQNQSHYQALVQNTVEGIFQFEFPPVSTKLPASEQIEHWYRHAVLTECNDSFVKMHGYNSAEVIIDTEFNYQYPFNTENFAYLESFIDSGYRSLDTESVECDRQGNPKHLLNNLIGIVKDGLIYGFWGLQRDITEQKRMQSALRSSEMRFCTIFEQAPIGIQILSRDGKIRANSALYQLFDLPASLFEYYNILEDRQLVDLGIMPLVQTFAGEIVIPPTFYDPEKSLPSECEYKGRKTWTQGILYPIKDEQGRFDEVVLMHVDVTTLKAAEAAILKQQERAAQERLAELSKANDALKQTVDVLATDSDLDRFLGHILKVIAEQFDAPLAEYWFHPEPGNIAYVKLTCWQGQILTPEEQPGHPGAIGFPVPPELVYNENLHQRQRHFIVEDITTDPLHINVSAQMGVDIGAWFTARGVNKILNVPLRLGEKTIGAMAVWLGADRHFTKQQIELAYALAQQVTLAIQLTELAEQAKLAAVACEREKAASQRAAELEQINAELRVALNQLAESEERFRTLFELSSEGFNYVEFDPPYPVALPIEEQCELFRRNLRVVKVNPAFAAMYGVDNPQDMVGLKIADVHVAGSQKNAAFIRAVVENGYRVRNVETEEIDSQGQRRYFLNSGAIAIENGYVVSGWGTQIDITQLRQTQQALLQAEQERAAELAQVNQELRQRDRILEATAMAANALLTLNNFDEAVNKALQIIGESLDTDRVVVIENFVLQSEPSSVYWRILYEWNSPYAVSQSSHPDLAQGSYEGIEEWYELCSKGQGISYMLEEMPYPFRSGQAELGVKALNVVPIFVEGKFWGVVGFDDCREAKRRSPAEFAVLKTAADCIGSAIQRSRIQRAREEAERIVLQEREKAAQEQAAELAKANHALKQTLDVLATEPELDKFLGQVLGAIANQFQSPLTEYWYHPDSDIAYVGMMSWQGRILNREEISKAFPTHPGLDGFRVPPELRGGESLQRYKQCIIYEDHSTHPFTQHLDWVANWIVPQGLIKELNVPMALGEETIGRVIIRLRCDRSFTKEQIELAQALAHQATLAVKLTQLAEESRQAAILKEQELAASQRVAQLAKANEALKKTLDSLAAQPELDTFLGQVLVILVEQLEGNGGSFWFFNDEAETEPQIHLDYDQGEIRTTDRTQHPGALPKRPFNSQQQQWQELKQSKKLLIHDDIANDPALENYRHHLLTRGIQRILVVPLVLCDRCVGVFSIRSTQKRQYQPEEIELAQALTQQATLAIQLTRLAEQSREAAILEERNRMALEIHDTLAQAFTGILMQLQAAKRFLATKPEQTSECIVRAQHLAREGLAEARRSIWYLRQDGTQSGDLLQILTRIVEQMTAGTSVQAEVCVQGTPFHLNAEVGMNLLRIAQESLTNALRHAQAQMIHISLSYESDRLQLRVRDDGQGFDWQHQGSSGFGLKGMRQRCDRIGAQLEINSNPGTGTEVTVVVLTN